MKVVCYVAVNTYNSHWYQKLGAVAKKKIHGICIRTRQSGQSVRKLLLRVGQAVKKIAIRG
jgi:hypothetical protein